MSSSCSRGKSAAMLVVLICAVVLCSVTQVRAQGPAKKNGKSLKTLIKQGNAALASENFPVAQSDFSAALVIDQNNLPATTGLGIAYAGLKDFIRAAPLMDKAIAANPSDRLAVFNAAAVNINGNSPMRAARILIDYLQAHPSDSDEPLANALAIALANASPQARNNALYQQADTFYKAYSAKLEMAVPDMKRWGIEWISSSDFADKQTTIASKQAELGAANARIAKSDAALASLKSKVPAMQERVQNGIDTQSALDSLNADIADQQDKHDKLTTARDSIVAALPAPTLPTTLDLMTADSLPAAVVAEAPAAQPNTPADNSQTPPVPQKPTAKIAYATAFPVAPDLLVTSAAAIHGATKLEILSTDGNTGGAQLVRADEATGLALVRLTDRRIAYLTLADDFAGGPVQCPTIPKMNIFNPDVQTLSGSAPAPADHWTVQLDKSPGLPGAPLMVAGKIVGVQLGDINADKAQLPAATLAQLKAFIGADLPATPGSGAPESVLLQISATTD